MERRELRRDAARNLERVLQAGREVFAERGLDATLNDVARHAGLGVGTVYRKFANKAELIDAILTQQVAELEEILTESLAKPDAWDGLVHYMECSLEHQTRDRGMAQLFAGRRIAKRLHDWERDRLAPLVDDVARRAREQGAIRPDITGTDLIFIQIGVLGVAATLSDGGPNARRADVDDVYRRFLWISLDGIRQPGRSRQKLPVPALTIPEAHAILARPQASHREAHTEADGSCGA